MNVVKSALQRMQAWLSPAKSAQLAPTAINQAPAKPGTRELAAMHAIRTLRDSAYGDSIKNEIQRATRRDLGLGSVALALDWLEDRGFVTVRESDTAFERGGRKRRYYSLTVKGDEALRD